MRTYGEAIDVRTDPRSDPWAAAAAAAAALWAEADGGALAGGSAGAGVGADIVSADELLGSARPAQFVWRGRLYLVREVLAHWVELGTWWTARGGAAGAHARRPAPAVLTGTAPSGTAPSEAPRSVSVDVGAVEREVWRVEASVGRATTPGVFDLVRDVPARAPGDPVTPDRWRLARALD